MSDERITENLTKAETDALLDRCFSFASVEDGRLVSDIPVNEVFPTLEEAEQAAQALVDSLRGEKALERGEGYWIFEIKAVRFVGRPLLTDPD